MPQEKPKAFVQLHGTDLPRGMAAAALFLPDLPYKVLMKEAAYGAAALAPWQILIPAVTECDKKFASDGVVWHEPFLCYWDREVAPLQPDSIVISSVCGKSIK